MLKVTNLLNLEATANEDSIVEAINLLTTAKNELETKLAETQEALTEAETAKTEAETAKVEAETKASEAEAEASELKAENLINQYATRVGDAKDSFKAMAIKNYAETENILKQLSLNVISNAIKTEEPLQPTKRTAASVMMEIKNRLNNPNK